MALVLALGAAQGRALAAAQPQRAPAATPPQRPETAAAPRRIPSICTGLRQSDAGLRAFLAANPRLASAPRAQQLAAFRMRGQLGWFKVVRPLFAQSILAGEMTGNGTGADLSAWAETMVPDGLQEARQFQLAATSPLRLMARFSEAYAAQVAGNDRLALASAQAALIDGARAWGADNAGLILGHTVVAQARLRAEDWPGAVAAADAGLRVIAANPRRATVLGPLRVNFLLIKADALDRLRTLRPDAPTILQGYEAAASQARAEARREEARHNLDPLSPSFDSAAIIPGMQPLSVWARQRNRTVLPGFLSGNAEESMTLISSGLSLAAGLVPSSRAPAPGPRRLTSGVAAIHEMIGCVNASKAAAEAGDLDGAAGANRALLALVNEQNFIAIGRERAAPEHSALRDAHEDAMYAVEEEMLGEESNLGLALAALVFVADGGLPDTARALERTVTPDAAGAILQAASRDPNSGISAQQLRSYGPDLARGLVYARTALALLLRPTEPRDVATMAEAAAWAEGNGAVRVRAFMREARIELDYEESERFFASPKGRFFLRLAPSVLRSFGWAGARAVGDDRAAGFLEADIYRLIEAQIRQETPAAAARLQASLSSLRLASGPPADRVLRDLTPVFTATIAATPYGHDEDAAPASGAAPSGAGAPPAAGAGEEGTEQSAEELMAAFVAFNAIPLAAEDNRWADIVRLGQGRMQIASFDDLTRYAMPYSLYLEALYRTGRGAEAVAQLSRILNTIRDQGGTPEADDQYAYLIPDRLLWVAAEVYAGQGRFADAYAFARLRLRRATLTATLPQAMGGLGLRHVDLEESRQVYRSPAEQLIYIASRLPQQARNWDEVLEAFDSAKASDAGDAILLRALVAATPGAAEPYAAYTRAVAALGRCERPNLSAAAGRVAPCDMRGPARTVITAKADLRTALPARGRGLLDSRVSLAGLRAALRPGELVVATAVVAALGEQRTAILTVSANGDPQLVLSPIPYAETEALVGRIGRAMQLGTQYRPEAPGGPSDTELTSLYMQLIAPVEPQVRAARHIIWSPDRALSEVPVAALRAPTPLPVPGEEPADYLGLARSLSFSPRLNALVMQRAAPARPTVGRSLAVGAIPFTGAPQRAGEGAPMGGISVGTLMDRRPTPLAADSIQNFVSVTRGGRALTGNGATLAALTAGGRQELDMLYFYTHGLSNEAETGQALILAPVQDGRLPLLDTTGVLGLNLQPQYVLLAACNTGSPRDIRSLQPYSGLVRSFLAIGARAVLTAQRQVDEAATASLMADLTALMARDGVSPGEALRRAQRHLQARLPYPILWAQFVWVGDSAGR